MALSQVIPETTIQKIGDKEYEIALSHTGASLARQIVNVNRRIIYTPINLIGMPGFGKTTGTHQLVYEIKKIDPSYIVRWHKKDDLLNIDKIVAALPKYQNYILIFDDVSYLLDPGSVSPERKSEILHKLTVIREIIDPENKRARCILMLDFHYSYAVPKAFRQANFSIQFSITDEERENYLKRVGYNKYKQRKIARFVSLFEKAYKSDNFSLNLRSGRKLFYETDSPFRPALVFNFSRIHFWLFHKVNDVATGPQGKKQDVPDNDFWLQLIKKYGLARVIKILRLYTFATTGEGTINIIDKAIWNHIRDQNAQQNLPLKELVSILKDNKKQPREERQSKLLESLQSLEKLVNARNTGTTDELQITEEKFKAAMNAELEQSDEDGITEEIEKEFSESTVGDFGADEDEIKEDGEE